MKNNIFKRFICPLCKRELPTICLSKHFNYYCQKKNQETLVQYYDMIYDGKMSELIKKYVNGYSLYELCQNDDCIYPMFSRSMVQKILIEQNIQIRNIEQSTRQHRCREKYEETCEKKYGIGIHNVSQSQEVKNAKCQTFLKNFGVDNIWKCDWWNQYQTEIMMKKYGVKRITGWTGKTQDERDEMNKKRFETKARNGYYDSSLEERIERIMTENNIKYQRPWFMYHHPYDFIFGDHKYCLLEVNGDYWHANPKIYKYNDVFSNGKTAQKIWDRDKKFRDCLIGTKWKLFYIWEYDMKQMTDEQILNFLNECLNYEDKENI